MPSKAWRDKLASEGGAEERPWSAGDNVQLATGQGDLQTNPLQMAVAYATLGTDGKVPTPHFGNQSRTPPAAPRRIRQPRQAPPDGQDQPRQPAGDHGRPARGGPGRRRHRGDVFGEFPIEIAGKTGTAERQEKGNQSWFIALSPYPSPDIVTVVTIEEGGYGAESAAPAVKEILEALYSKQLEKAAESSAEEGAIGEEEAITEEPLGEEAVTEEPAIEEPAIEGTG